MSDEQPMTREEAAQYMRKSVSWLDRSDVPRCREGRTVWFLKSQCDAYLRARLSHVIEEAA